MKLKNVVSQSLYTLRVGVTAIALFQFTVGGMLAQSVEAATNTGDNATTSPIKHVIVIIGENRSYDHVFATYKPKAGEQTNNLLSQGIVNADGTPGPNFAKAQQLQARTDNDPFPPEPERPVAILEEHHAGSACGRPDDAGRSDDHRSQAGREWFGAGILSIAGGRRHGHHGKIARHAHRQRERTAGRPVPIDARSDV
jgi:hypothetical protein